MSFLRSLPYSPNQKVKKCMRNAEQITSAMDVKPTEITRGDVRCCQLCGSTEDYLNFHHLIPKTLHTSKFFKKKYDKEYMKSHGVWICKFYCHKQIHIFIEEKVMGLVYNTLDKLLEHEDVKKYVAWRRKRVI